jgi:hypothetical protein
MSCSASSDDGRTALTDLQYDPLYKAVGHDWRSTGLVNKQLLSLVRHCMHYAHAFVSVFALRGWQSSSWF